jgi:aspartyl aminopeptidase
MNIFQSMPISMIRQERITQSSISPCSVWELPPSNLTEPIMFLRTLSEIFLGNPIVSMSDAAEGSGLLGFFSHCISPFHMIAHIRSLLTAEGYVELSSISSWPDPLPDKAFLVRDEIAVIAFSIGTRDSVIILNTDYDFPFLRPRPNSAYEHNGQHYVILEHNGARRLDIRSYGDQQLSVAGAVFVREEGRIVRRLISRSSVAFLPSMPAVVRGEPDRNSFPALIGGRSLLSVVAELCECTESAIVDWDLRFSAADPAREIAGKVHADCGAELSNCYAVLTAFLQQSKTSSGVKMMAIYAGGISRKFLRTGPGSDFFDSVGRAIFRGSDYAAIKLKSLNIVVETIIPDKLDKTCKLKSGVAIRTGARSDATTEMIGQAIVTEIAKISKAKLEIAGYSNMVVGPASIAPKLMETTDIRTVQIAQNVQSQASTRPIITLSTWKTLVTFLTAAYDQYDTIKPLFA